MNELRNRPSPVALGTAAIFHPMTLLLCLGGFLVGGFFFWHWKLVRTFVWLGTLIATAIRVSSLVNDPDFIARVAGESDLLSGRPTGAVLLALGDASLTGPYLESFQTSRLLIQEILSEIKALPRGPVSREFQGVSGRLESFLVEVRDLAARGQKLEAAPPSADASGARNARVEDVRGQLSKIVSTLEETRARMRSLRATLHDELEGGASLMQSLDDISRDVKFLSETVEETTKLLSDR